MSENISSPRESDHDGTIWKIERIDAGMGETDYNILLNDTFYAKTEHLEEATAIVRAMERREPAASAEQVLEELEQWVDENWYESPDSPESYECTPVINSIELHQKIAELRSGHARISGRPALSLRGIDHQSVPSPGGGPLVLPRKMRDLSQSPGRALFRCESSRSLYRNR